MTRKFVTLCVLGILLFTQPCFAAASAGDEGRPVERQPGRGQIPDNNIADVIAEDVMSQRVRDEFASNEKLFDASNGKHIVAFLGNTGAGKSTLINLLAGIELTSQNGEYTLTDTNNKRAMQIGGGGRSETLYPNYIDVNGLSFFDLPGFKDTDGSVRNLVNAAFIRQILTLAASVRLVFVAGEDQITADRGDSISNFFNSIGKLFGTNEQENFVQGGVFIATKMFSNNVFEYLNKKTDSEDKRQFNRQLQHWNTAGTLHRVFHAALAKNNDPDVASILSCIEKISPVKIVGLNVSALYPPETNDSLTRMFLRVLQQKLNDKFQTQLKTVADYDKAIAYYSLQEFWITYSNDVGENDSALRLLKEFSMNPYNEAVRQLEARNADRLITHLQSLSDRRQQRIDFVKDGTKNQMVMVIANLVPKQADGSHLQLDFAHHKDYYEQVCGASFITNLATDQREQEIVRQTFVTLIAEHSHKQMLTWHQQHVQPQMDALKEQLDTLKTAFNNHSHTYEVWRHGPQSWEKTKGNTHSV